MAFPPPQQFAAWARAVRASDTEAFAELYHVLRAPVLRHVLTVTQDEESAYDILHDVFERLWTMRHRIDPERSIRAFVFRMAHNDALKSKRRGKHEVGWPESLPAPASSPGLESSLDAAELRRLLAGWIKQMPPRRRAVFELSRSSGMTHAEIGEVLGISPKTVNNQIIAALRYLRTCLRGYGLDPHQL